MSSSSASLQDVVVPENYDQFQSELDDEILDDLQEIDQDAAVDLSLDRILNDSLDPRLAAELSEALGSSSTSGATTVDEDSAAPSSSCSATTHSRLDSEKTDWKRPTDLLNQQHKRHRWAQQTQAAAAARSLRLDKLRPISAQLHRLQEDTGHVTCIAVHDWHANSSAGESSSSCTLACGTSTGRVLIYDLQSQALKCSLVEGDAGPSGRKSRRKRADGTPLGPVASLAFAPDAGHPGRKLAIGYARGHVQVVDAHRGRPVMTLRPHQAHQAGRGVTQVAWTSSSAHLLCLDSGGSLFLVHTVAGLVSGRHSRLHCVFSGCHGEAVSVCPLASDCAAATPHGKMKVYVQANLLAVVTLTKYMVLTINDDINQVAFGGDLPPGRPHTAPLLAWHWCPIEFGSGESNKDISGDVSGAAAYPVLCVCRGTVFKFIMAHALDDGQFFRQFILKTIDLASVGVSYVLAMNWLAGKHLIVLDGAEMLRLVQIDDNETTPKGDASTEEVVDASHVQLVYQTAVFKGSTAGSGVSPALNAMASSACYQSVCCSGAIGGRRQVLLLGDSGLYAVSARSWLERIDALLHADDYVHAIRLSLAFYTGRERVSLSPNTALLAGAKSKSVVNGVGGKRRWQLVVAQRTVDLVLEAVAHCVELQQQFVDAHALDAAFKRLVPLIVDACILLQRHDILYEAVYERICRSPLAVRLLLECLEDRLLDGWLHDIPPQLVQALCTSQAFVQQLADDGDLHSLEQCLVRLPVDRLDLHQVMTLCRANRLWDGIAYVYNRALNEYIEPLADMCAALASSLDKCDSLLSDQDILLGNKVLLYVSCCLCGTAYPIGSLPDESRARQVSREVYQWLIAPNPWQANGMVTSDGRVGNAPAGTYPRLRLLLHFDTREFLNVLSMAFHSQMFADDSGHRAARQLLGLLVGIMAEPSPDSSPDTVGSLAPDWAGWQWWQCGALLQLLARLCSNWLAQAGHQPLPVDSAQLNKVISTCLLGSGNSSASSQSAHVYEQSLVELITFDQRAACPDARLVHLDSVASLAEKCALWRVLHLVYWETANWAELVTSCVREAVERPELQSAVTHRVRSVYRANEHAPAEQRHQLTEVLLKLLPKLAELDTVGAAELLLEFVPDKLTALPDMLREHADDTAKHAALAKLLFAVFKLKAGGSDAGSAALTGDTSTDGQLLVACARALCTRSLHADALRLVQLWSPLLDQPNTWHQLLQCAADNGALALLVWLCDWRGELRIAAEKLLKRIGECARSLQHYQSGEQSEEATLDTLVSAAGHAVSVCQRRRQLADARGAESERSESNQSCLELFEALLDMPAEVVTQSNVAKTCVANTLQALAKIVDAHQLMQRLLSCSWFSRGTYREHYALISAIIADYTWHGHTLQSLLACVRLETCAGIDTLRRAGAKGSAVGENDKCHLCARHAKGRMPVFRCGHLVHWACARKRPDDNALRCPLCRADGSHEQLPRGDVHAVEHVEPVLGAHEFSHEVTVKTSV